MAGLRLEGLTGTRGGLIGALAAVGLRAGGNDGRYLWLPHLRELNGKISVRQLKCLTGAICQIASSRAILPEAAEIETGSWLRPILQDGMPVILCEETPEHEWCVLSKESIKQLSD